MRHPGEDGPGTTVTPGSDGFDTVAIRTIGRHRSVGRRSLRAARLGRCRIAERRRSSASRSCRSCARVRGPREPSSHVGPCRNRPSAHGLTRHGRIRDSSSGRCLTPAGSPRGTDRRHRPHGCGISAASTGAPHLREGVRPVTRPRRGQDSNLRVKTACGPWSVRAQTAARAPPACSTTELPRLDQCLTWSSGIPDATQARSRIAASAPLLGSTGGEIHGEANTSPWRTPTSCRWWT